MQDIITSLQADPMGADRIHIFIDGQHTLAVALDVIAREMLAVGQHCPPSRVAQLQALQDQHLAYEAALTFLSYRPRSAREVEMRLRKKQYTPELIEATMTRLSKQGLVNDREFSRSWISNRQTISPRGPHLLRSELRAKGVAKEIVDEAMSAYQEEQADRAEQAAEVSIEYGITDEEPAPGSDEESALMLARKRMRVLATLDPQVQKRRLAAFLARRGYNYGTIDTVMRRVLNRQDDEDDSEENE